MHVSASHECIESCLPMSGCTHVYLVSAMWVQVTNACECKSRMLVSASHECIESCLPCECGNEWLHAFCKYAWQDLRQHLCCSVHESWHICNEVMAHMQMGLVTHVDESLHTCEGVMARMWRSHGAHVRAATPVFQCVCVMTLRHGWRGHGTNVHGWCLVRRKYETWRKNG